VTDVMPALDPQIRDLLTARLRFYRDLGLTDFYGRPVDPALIAKLENVCSPSVQTDNQQASRNNLP